ncbi:cell envelope integrity protein CreD [bacterium]|nr:cell envelope integrity protein CreD [bacterium]
MKKTKKTVSEKTVPAKAEGLSVGLRLFVIALLTAVLLIPSFSIHFLIQDRDNRKRSVIYETAMQWSGGMQDVTALVLTLPYKRYFKDEKGRIQHEVLFAHFLPETLDINGRMAPEIRYRGIYKVALYNADLKVKGRFVFPNIDALNLEQKQIIWEDAFVTLGMSNTKSIQEKVVLKWNDKSVVADPGVPCKDVVASGVSFRVALNSKTYHYDYSFDLTHNGHEMLQFVPLGKLTHVQLEAPWGDPSFSGAFLPDTRAIKENHFQATWDIIDINRNFPQQWLGSSQQVQESAFGVRLFMPVDHYQKTSRTVKYSIMFIGLTFLALFMLDVMGRAGHKPIHPIQYLLIGMALVLFYTLLLSLSEHIGFGLGYLIASIGIIGLITLYTKSLLANLRHTGLISLVLSVLYAYLYTVLQLEDYALLIGSVSLFSILALVMYLTRKIDWSDIGGSNPVTR